MLATLNLTIVVGLAFAIFVSVATGFEQRFVLYNTDYCDPSDCKPGVHCPPNENITFTTSQSVIPPPWNNLSHAFHEHGAWVLGAFNGTHEGRYPPSNIFDGRCNLGDRDHDPEMTLTYLEKIGPDDTLTIQLVIFSGEVFTGTSEIIENDERFLNMGAVKSYAFFGNAAWLLYPFHNYEGTPKCVRHRHPNPDIYTANSNALIQVGSVRQTTYDECGAVIRTTRPTTTSTTTTTTPQTTTNSEPTGTSSNGPGGGEGSGVLITPNTLSTFLSILLSFFIVKYF